MQKIEKFLDKYWWLVLLLLSIPLFGALLVHGYYGASDDLHIGWLYEMDRTINLGQIPPRFVPDLSYGFGYPLFNYVFPLPFYIGEIFHKVGFSLVDSVKWVFLISLPMSMYGMYLLLRKLTIPLIALAGALVYGYTPYRSTDIYVRGDIGEAFSFVFLPLLTLSLLQVFSEDGKVRNRWIGVGGLSLAGLVLTHNITAYMFLPFYILLGILLLIFTAKKSLKLFASLISLGLLGALSSLYFWFPAIADSKLVKYDTVFNFVDHFPTLKQPIVPYWG
jgi:hypothetical protein